MLALQAENPLWQIASDGKCFSGFRLGGVCQHPQRQNLRVDPKLQFPNTHPKCIQIMAVMCILGATCHRTSSTELSTCSTISVLKRVWVFGVFLTLYFQIRDGKLMLVQQLKEGHRKCVVSTSGYVSMQTLNHTVQIHSLPSSALGESTQTIHWLCEEILKVKVSTQASLLSQNNNQDVWWWFS